jgi:glutamyl-tRNA reductase
LAAEFQGYPVAFEEFPNQLHQVDIVLTSTGAPNFILEKPKVEEVLRQRKNKPMFFIDIAVPRDLDPKVNSLDNIYLYDVDDLQGVVQANLKERHKEAKKAETIIDQEIGQFHAWLATLEIKPTIIALRQKLEEIRQGELDKSLKNLKGLGDKERRSVESLTAAIINKILHLPISTLKQAQNGSSEDGYVDAVRTLFGLESSVATDELPPLDEELE